MKRRFGIRFKLLLVSLSLLAIPLAGYQFIREMETFLRDAQDSNLSTTTQALSLLVQGHPDLEPNDSANGALYAHPFQPVIIDGYGDDWQTLSPMAQSFDGNDGQRFQVLLNASSSYLYLLLQVQTPDIRYALSPGIHYGGSDQVELLLTDGHGLSHRYLIAPRAPGSIIPLRLKDREPQAPDDRLRGEWQEVAGGYNLEMRIPRKLAQSGLRIRVMDALGKQLATGDMEASASPGKLIMPSRSLQALIQSVDLPNSRIWITDANGWVLASNGELPATSLAEDSAVPWLFRKILNHIFRHQAGETLPDEQNGILLLNNPVVKSALAGKPATRRYRMPGSETLVIANARPLMHQQQISGAVMLEQTTGNILSLQNHAMQRLLALTFSLFVVVALALLGYASLLTSRIRRLHRQMEQAVAPDGRIVGEIQVSPSGDEIASLGQSFSDVLGRLQEYNRYLQAMASRLSHEFRTPLAIIRTSLENSSQVDDAAEKQAYLARALKGVDRLELILRQLQEATRLEKALEQVEIQTFDLCELLQASMENYASIHPHTDFQLSPCTAVQISGAPELVHQALEKLLDNAVDFHAAGTPITLQLRLQDQQAFICVSNRGSELPDNMDPFQSMVSLRKDKQEQPHLGLGLYLVKLIAEFHNGQTHMHSHPEEQSVSFCFSIAMKKEGAG